jgi:hypothetical protein
LLGTGAIWLVTAVAKGDCLSAVAAVGAIIAGFANYVDRRNWPLRSALVGTGLMVFAACVYLRINNYQFWDLFHDIFER